MCVYWARNSLNMASICILFALLSSAAGLRSSVWNVFFVLFALCGYVNTQLFQLFQSVLELWKKSNEEDPPGKSFQKLFSGLTWDQHFERAV